MNSPDHNHYALLLNGNHGGGGGALSSLNGDGAGAGGFSLGGGRLQQQSPRESALAAAMRSLRAAERPSHIAAANTAPNASANSIAAPNQAQGNPNAAAAFPSGLNFTNELSARQAVLEVLAKHNASSATQTNDAQHNQIPATKMGDPSCLAGKFNNVAAALPSLPPFESSVIKPKCQMGFDPVAEPFSSARKQTTKTMQMQLLQQQQQRRSSSPAVSKKALLMKRACLEAESRPPSLKKARKTLGNAARIPAGTGAGAANANSDGDSDANDTKALVPPSNVPLTTYLDDDVLCGRGGGTNVHPGNRRFRDLIHANRRRYLKAKKNDKPAISRSIVRSVRRAGGRFLRKDDKLGVWFEIGDAGAREKTSQALRQRAPEMKKILFEDEAQRDGMHLSAVVEYQQHAAHQNALAQQHAQVQAQQQQLFAAAAAEKMDFATSLFANPQQFNPPSAAQPIPTDATDLRRLAREQNAGLSVALAASIGRAQQRRSQDSQGMSAAASVLQQEHRMRRLSQDSQGLSAAASIIQQQEAEPLQQQKPGPSNDALLQARLGMDPHAAYVQRNAQAWTTQTLLGRGINTFTPNIA